uniref:Fucosyltransferase n=1 Tax=Oncorhynchus tshawytscha TaxID=74940 RepID=A0A8C8C7P0_ONCTS
MLGQDMSTPASQSGLRPVLMMTFLLGLSFMYYKPQIKFLSCPIDQASHLGKACCPPCPQVRRARNQMVNQTHHAQTTIQDDYHFDLVHSVKFHHRDIHGDLKNMPQEQRPWFQKWVWWNGESPANTNRIPGVDHLFNLTASYRLDSDIKVPYGSLVEVRSEDNIFELPKKDKLVCWVVSNWNPNYKKVQVFNELSRHVKVEAYGRHFSRYLEN